MAFGRAGLTATPMVVDRLVGLPPTPSPRRVSDGAIRVRRHWSRSPTRPASPTSARSWPGLGVEILSTGGAATALPEAGVEVTDVSKSTGQQEILDGRVKTLHPRLHAALLARREDPAHMATLGPGDRAIDLVCVNLYPFEQTVAARGGPRGRDREHRHGGPRSRAAAKNHEGVAVMVKPESDDQVCAELEESGGEIGCDPALARREAFAQTAHYDAAISRSFSTADEDFPEHLAVAYEKVLDLSYGENPHQRAALYSEAGGAATSSRG